MLLVIDVGNTQTAYGLYFQGSPDGNWRVATRAEQTADEIAVLVDALLASVGHRLAEVTGVCLASVAPTATATIIEMCAKHMHVAPLVVDADVKSGLKINYNPPESVGADRIANSVGGYDLFGGPLLIVDFGTATTFDVISKSGVYQGGIIAPGVLTGADALIKTAAKLSGVALEAPGLLVGTDTDASLRSGLLYGAAAMVDGLVAGVKAERKTDFRTIATGGLVEVVAPHCRTIESVEPLLTLHGLKRIWDLNLQK